MPWVQSVHCAGSIGGDVSEVIGKVVGEVVGEVFGEVVGEATGEVEVELIEETDCGIFLELTRCWIAVGSSPLIAAEEPPESAIRERNVFKVV
jgi:hypothetical protein